MPQSEILNSEVGVPLALPPSYRSSSTWSPSISSPTTTCRPSSQGVGRNVMKNWQPFESRPELAIANVPLLVNVRLRYSSGNDFP